MSEFLLIAQASSSATAVSTSLFAIDSWMGISVFTLAAGAAIVAVGLVSHVLLSARADRFSLRHLAGQTLALWWALPVAAVLVLFAGKAVPQFAGSSSGGQHEAIPHDDESHEDESTPGIPDDSLISAEGDEEPPPAAAAAEQHSRWDTPIAAVDAPLPDWATQTSSGDESAETDTDAADHGQTVVIPGRQFATVEEAEADVARLAQQRIRQHISRSHGLPADWTVPESLLAESTLVPRRHIETISRKSGRFSFNVYRAWWEVSFSPAAEAVLEPVWQEQIVTGRLWALGGLVALLTLLTGTATSYLRLDAVTAGRYRGRLKLAAVLLVLAGGGLGLALLPIA